MSLSYHGYRFAGTFPDETARLQFHLDKWLRYHLRRKGELMTTATAMVFTATVFIIIGMSTMPIFGGLLSIVPLFLAIACLTYPVGCWQKAFRYHIIYQKFVDLKNEYVRAENLGEEQLDAAFLKIVDIHDESPDLLDMSEVLAEFDSRRGLLGDTGEFVSIPLWRRMTAGMFTQHDYVQQHHRGDWAPEPYTA